MSYPTSWTEREDRILIEVIEVGGTFNEASEKTGRSRDACKNRAAKLGVESKFNKIRAEKASENKPEIPRLNQRLNNLGHPYAARWTRQEDAVLLSMRKERIPLEEIALAVGRSKDACETRIKRIGFRVRLNYKRRSPKWKNKSPSSRPDLKATLLEQLDALGGKLYLVHGEEHEHIVPEAIVRLSDRWVIGDK